ncbi:MAG TPA: cytochrome c biogenesis protein ResB [Pyrinomonadaceae bacterium]|nr:cytochrome c biogenesis protein ResB [Pyrinomonadaceae bacterium]
MAIAEQTAPQPTLSTASKRASRKIIERFIDFISSVRFGVTLLILLAAACMTGMLIMQQNVSGFDRYFAELTPSQRLVYGYLGLFDIYHAWYFNALLAVLSLNIVLASIDRFPKTWASVMKAKTAVPLRWLREQSATEEIELESSVDDVSQRIESGMKDAGWKRIEREMRGETLYIKGESGRWNRFSAYPVHIALLTIFLGGFLTAQLGSTGQVPLKPGKTTDIMSDTVATLDRVNEVTMRLPFTLQATDIQQNLIKRDGSLSAMNTIDWITRFTITDETGTHEAMVQMNRPYDYRGYRFFQSSFTPIGRARIITVAARPAVGGEPELVTIPRNGSARLTDGTTVGFAEFRGNFRIGKEDPNEDTSEYPNPGAVLSVTPPNGSAVTAYAFGPKMADIPAAKNPIGGYTYQLTDFEKAADQHILSVQRDPGATVVYVGFVLLFLTLAATFLFSHQQVWAAVSSGESGRTFLVLGGNASRNANSFNEKFARFAGQLRNSR